MTSFNIHQVQPLLDGRILLACVRCHYRDGDLEKNGRIYHPDGTLSAALTLGDGIQEVGVASDGRIWTSYFDEGVFGNFGWDTPRGAPVWIRKGKVVRHWKIPVSGSSAFAVSATHALFRGGYDQRDDDHLLELKGAAGRGESLFLLRGTEVFRLSIERVLSETR